MPSCLLIPLDSALCPALRIRVGLLCCGQPKPRCSALERCFLCPLRNQGVQIAPVSPLRAQLPKRRRSEGVCWGDSSVIISLSLRDWLHLSLNRLRRTLVWTQMFWLARGEPLSRAVP